MKQMLSSWMAPAVIAVACLFAATPASAQQISTDKLNYSPGDRVTIAGSAWQPNEAVTLTISGVNGGRPDVEIKVTADAEGAFKDASFVVQEIDRDLDLRLTARGGSGAEIKTVFRDGIAPGSLICLNAAGDHQAPAFDSTHYRAQPQQSITCAITGATDLSAAQRAGTVPTTVLVRTAGLGNTPASGVSIVGGTNVWFTWTPPANACGTSVVSYGPIFLVDGSGNIVIRPAASNDSNNFYLNNNVANAAAGFTYVDAAGQPIACPPFLKVEKQPKNGVFLAGSQVTYTIVVTNLRVDPAVSVHLVDALPGNGGLVWLTASPTQGSCVNPIASNALNCSLGTIAPGASVTVTVKSTSTTPLEACQDQPNAAAIATDEDELFAQDSGFLTCTPPTPHVSITKSPKGATFAVGQPLTFSLVVTSDGPQGSMAHHVTVSDPLPTTGGLTWAVTSVSPGPNSQCSVNAAQTLTCDFGDLLTGISRTVVVMTTNTGGAPVDACTGATLDNVATVTSTDAGTMQDTGSYTCRPPEPHVSIIKAPKGATFTVGQPLSFTLVVASDGQTGSTAHHVTVNDPLPTTGGLTWAVSSVTPGPIGQCGVNAAQTLTCDFGDLATGQFRTIVITTSNAGGAPAGSCTGQTLNNVATVTSTDAGTAQDTGSYNCTAPPPHVSITKNPKGATFTIGQPLTFTVVVTSDGQPGSTAHSVALSDPLPTTGGLTWGVTSVTPGPIGQCSVNAAQTLICAFGDLPQGQGRTVVVTSTNVGGAPAASCTGQTLNNIATVTSTDAGMAQDTGSYTCTPPPPAPHVSITKNPKAATFNIGDPLTFTMVVTSDGPPGSIAHHVTVSDPIPTAGVLTWAVTSVSPGPITQCSVNASQTLTCDFGDLVQGQVRTIVVTTTNVMGAPIASCTGQALNNVATVTSTDAGTAQDTGSYICTPPPPTACPAGSFKFSYDAAGNLKIVYDQFPAPNDNSYGVNAVGWTNHTHKFSDLVGSDHAGFQIKNPAGTVVLSFNIDYITANTTAPSGYASAGPFGGDGGILTGTLTPADITFTTSLANNLNNINIPGLFNAAHVQQFGSVNLLIDSPPTDPLHQTYVNSDPLLAGWDFHDTYFVTINKAKLDAMGFDPATWAVEPNLSALHNSPAKVCPPSTPPPGTSGLSVTKLEVKDKQVKITILNSGSADEIITALATTWPAINGKLVQVKLDGDILYDNPDIPAPSANLGTAQLNADPNKRKIQKGTSDVLTLIFEKNADTNLSNYTGTITTAGTTLKILP